MDSTRFFFKGWTWSVGPVPRFGFRAEPQQRVTWCTLISSPLERIKARSPCRGQQQKYFYLGVATEHLKAETCGGIDHVSQVAHQRVISNCVVAYPWIFQCDRNPRPYVLMSMSLYLWDTKHGHCVSQSMRAPNPSAPQGCARRLALVDRWGSVCSWPQPAKDVLHQSQDYSLSLYILYIYGEPMWTNVNHIKLGNQRSRHQSVLVLKPQADIPVGYGP